MTETITFLSNAVVFAIHYFPILSKQLPFMTHSLDKLHQKYESCCIGKIHAQRARFDSGIKI